MADDQVAYFHLGRHGHVKRLREAARLVHAQGVVHAVTQEHKASNRALFPSYYLPVI